MYSSTKKKTGQPSQGRNKIPNSDDSSPAHQLDVSDIQDVSQDFDVSIENNQDIETLNSNQRSKLGSISSYIGLTPKKIIVILTISLLAFIVFGLGFVHLGSSSPVVKIPKTGPGTLPKPIPHPTEPKEPVKPKDEEPETPKDDEKTPTTEPKKDDTTTEETPKKDTETPTKPKDDDVKTPTTEPKKDEEKSDDDSDDEDDDDHSDYKDELKAPHPYTKAFSSFKFDNPTPLASIHNMTIEPEDYIPKLQVACYLYSKDHLNIIIKDADKERYELAHEYPFPYPKDPVTTALEKSDFIVSIEKDPFDIVVKRRSTGEKIFKLTDRLVFTNLYIEISFFTPTNELYGFGERIGPLQYHQGTFTLFIVDRIGLMDHGKPGFNAQGHHSMYLNKETSGLYHVNLLKNIAAQEVEIQANNKITWKLIGGVLDFSFFLGDSPEDALQKYHNYIGGWTLPAFWHLGHHQSKWWGYNNLAELEYVLSHFDEADLPLDAMWSDLEIFKYAANFNYDEERYAHDQMQALYAKYNKRWITVVQAYIPDQKDTPCWTYPNTLDYAVKDGLTGQPLRGYEFSGWMYFFDFLNPKTEHFWDTMLDHMNSKMKVSGVWLDANEVTDLINVFDYTKPIHKKDLQKRKYFKLPFYPGAANLYELHIINLDSIHAGGIEEYNVRSLSPFYQSQFTYNYLKRQKDIYFPFVLSRGNQFGNGQFSFHFIPDLGATWESLRNALAPVMNYNIYGIPMVGADICGMGSNYKSPPELCARWYQMGVFYTFARNHHTPRNNEDNFQEPYKYDGIYFDTIKAHIQLRYSLMKQLYTYFFTNHRQSNDKKLRVGTVMRPLFFEFRDKTLPPFGSHYFEDQFMISDAIMGAPVLDPGRNQLDIYFPQSRWFDMRYNKEVNAHGTVMQVQAELTTGLPYFLRGGKMIMKQKVAGIRRSDDLDNSFTMIAGLDFPTQNDGKQQFSATGAILDANDYSEETIYNQCVMKECLMRTVLVLSLSEKETSIVVKSVSPVTEIHKTPVTLTNIMLLGVPKHDSLKDQGQFMLDSKKFGYSFDQSLGVLTVDISSDPLILSNGKEHKLVVV